MGTLFPLESKESCIDSVDTPKTFALQIKAFIVKRSNTIYITSNNSSFCKMKQQKRKNQI